MAAEPEPVARRTLTAPGVVAAVVALALLTAATFAVAFLLGVAVALFELGRGLL